MTTNPILTPEERGALVSGIGFMDTDERRDAFHRLNASHAALERAVTIARDERDRAIVAAKRECDALEADLAAVRAWYDEGQRAANEAGIGPASNAEAIRMLAMDLAAACLELHRVEKRADRLAAQRDAALDGDDTGRAHIA